MARTEFHAYRAYALRDGKRIWSACGRTNQEATENYRFGLENGSIPPADDFVVVKIKQKELGQ